MNINKANNRAHIKMMVVPINNLRIQYTCNFFLFVILLFILCSKLDIVVINHPVHMLQPYPRNSSNPLFD